MIEITENIIINANINLVWSFISDFSKSLLFNRFHIKIDLPSEYSISKIKKFKIIHNFGFGNYEMLAEVKNVNPPKHIALEEYYIKDKNKGFPHTINYNLKSINDKTKIIYTLEGTYGGKVQDLSFKPIVKGVMIEELLNIKNAIESSESASKSIPGKSIKPI